jgi:hypothetical protein
MKNLILALFLCLPFGVKAQHPFITENEVTTDDVTVSAWIISTTEDFDEAIQNLKSFMNDKYDLKIKKENNQTFIIEEVDLPHFSVKRGDLKTYLVPTDSVNVMAFSFLLGYDISINSRDYPKEMAELKKIVINFMEFHYHEYYNKRIDDETRILNKVQKNLQQDENKIGSMRKKVASLDKKARKETDEAKVQAWQSEISALENEIQTLLGGLPEQRENVSTHNQKISEIKNEMNDYHQVISGLLISDNSTMIE